MWHYYLFIAVFSIFETPVLSCSYFAVDGGSTVASAMISNLMTRTNLPVGEYSPGLQQLTCIAVFCDVKIVLCIYIVYI